MTKWLGLVVVNKDKSFGPVSDSRYSSPNTCHFVITTQVVVVSRHKNNASNDDHTKETTTTRRPLLLSPRHALVSNYPNTNVDTRCFVNSRSRSHVTSEAITLHSPQNLKPNWSISPFQIRSIGTGRFDQSNFKINPKSYLIFLFCFLMD